MWRKDILSGRWYCRFFGACGSDPAQVFFMWPLAVAVDGGRCLWTASVVRPGYDEKLWLLMALIHVDGGGLNAHRWRNCISLALELVMYALRVVWDKIGWCGAMLQWSLQVLSRYL